MSTETHDLELARRGGACVMCDHGLRRRVIDSDKLDPAPCVECDSEEALASYSPRRFRGLNRQQARIKYDVMSQHQWAQQAGTQIGARFIHTKRQTTHEVSRFGNGYTYLRRVPDGQRSVMVSNNKLKEQFESVMTIDDVTQDPAVVTALTGTEASSPIDRAERSFKHAPGLKPHKQRVSEAWQPPPVKPLHRLDRSTVYATREQWLEARKGFIGGSVVAKIMLDANSEPLSRYGGPMKVYVDLKGAPDPDPYTDKTTLYNRMEIGHWLEETIAKMAVAALEGHELTMLAHTIVTDPVAPHLGVTPDAVFTDSSGRRAGLECKNSSMSGDHWPRTHGVIADIEPGAESGLPADYEIQCQACMAVTGFDHWYLAALLWGNDLRVWRIHRDDDVISWMREHVEGFWRTHVEGDVVPALTMRDLQPDRLAERVVGTQDDGSKTHLDYEQYAHWAKGAHEAGQRRKEAETAEKFSKAQLLLGMGEATQATCGRYKITAKTNKWGHRQIRVTPEKTR